MLWLCLSCTVACGGDKDADARSAAMDAGHHTSGAEVPPLDAGPPTNDASGDAAAGDAASDGSSGLFEASEPAPCGSTLCPGSPPLFPGTPGPKACCVDPLKGTCGKQNMSGQCEPPPPPDARCPSFYDYKGCCTSTGMCGVDVSVFNLGCVDVGDKMFRLFNPNAPERRRCDASAEDAEASDAG
jgi:hypothetical protein